MNAEERNLILRAISFAAWAHRTQMRKDGVTPYIAHPLRVLTILSTVFGVRDPEVLAAGALHDTIEDTQIDRDDLSEHFGPRVAEFVALLSKDMRQPEAEREQRYYDAVAAAPLEVKLCKLADTLDNLVDSTGLSAAGRAKKVRKARQLVDRLATDFPADWSHVLQCVRDQIAVVERADRGGGG
jgi:guanosine-3',5'-bis(diphosphate) 3'-pyrophosphohydrolase